MSSRFGHTSSPSSDECAFISQVDNRSQPAVSCQPMYPPEGIVDSGIEVADQPSGIAFG
jgi:hypothetical protein